MSDVPTALPISVSQNGRNDREFHLAEYKSLRDEIISIGARYDQLKVIILGGKGTLYSWMLSNFIGFEKGEICIKNNVVVIIAMLPLALSYLAALDAVWQYNYSAKITSYIKILENHLGA